MIIRFATENDLASIMKIEKSSFIPEIQENSEVFKTRILTFQKGFVVFEDSENHTIAGYLSSERWNSIPKDNENLLLSHSIKKSHKNDGIVLYISSFAILPDYRGKGSGKLLFKNSINFILNDEPSKNIHHLLLLVNEDWKGAYHIYESSGFKTIRSIQNVFPKTDGLLMQKDI